MTEKTQRPLFEMVEDAEADQAVADEKRVLGDEELHAGGLRPVRSWVRTKASRNALRQRRMREREEAQGIKQVTVKTKPEYHDAVKQLAQVSREGDLVQALRTLLEQLDPDSVRDLDPADRRLLQAARVPGLRARLIRMLAGS